MPMDGGVPFRENLAARAKRIADLSPAMQAIGKEAQRQTDAAFAGQRTPAGAGWAPLAPSTVRKRLGALRPDSKGKRRDRAGRFNAGTVKALDATGRLKRAAVKFRVTPTGVQWVLPDYGRFHMTGTPRMPQREFAPFEARGTDGWVFAPELLGYAIRILAKHERGEPLR